jgi:hypothetical protein
MPHRCELDADQQRAKAPPDRTALRIYISQRYYLNKQKEPCSNSRNLMHRPLFKKAVIDLHAKVGGVPQS